MQVRFLPGPPDKADKPGRSTRNYARPSGLSLYRPDATRLWFLPEEIATITYRSGPEWDIRFGRQLEASSKPAEQRTPALCADFLIETYLDHQVSPILFH